MPKRLAHGERLLRAALVLILSTGASAWAQAPGPVPPRPVLIPPPIPAPPIVTLPSTFQPQLLEIVPGQVKCDDEVVAPVAGLPNPGRPGRRAQLPLPAPTTGLVSVPMPS